MAYISTIISGAASIGVLLGLLSGIFLLVLTALRWICRVRATLYEEELRRQKSFLINNSYLSGDDKADFRKTKKVENGFACALGENNYQEKINQRSQNKSESATEWREHETDLKVPEKEGPNLETVKVRELIEKIVETIIEGPLDGTTVGQLSTHSAYLGLFTKYHNLLGRELARLGFALHLSVVRKNAFEIYTSDLKQSNLKRLIKRIVSEAMALPNIKKNLCPPKSLNKTENDDFKNKSYEDILATAILNKITDNFQNKNYAESGKVDGNPKPKLRSKKVRKNDDIKSDDDWSDTSRSEQLSLTIEEYIEEVTTTVEASDSDSESDFSDFEMNSNRQIPFPESGKIVIDAGADDENSDFDEQNAATQLITSMSSWEENWLFQKKRLRSTPNAHHPVPVPMLVPNPSEDFRALVGGVDADDLSDISDCSDAVLEDLIPKEEKSLTQHLSADCETQEAFGNGVEKNEIEELQKMQIHSWKEFYEDKNVDILDSEIQNINDNNCNGVLKESEKYSVVETNEDVKENLPSLNLSEMLSQRDRDSSIEDFFHQYESINNSLSTSEKDVFHKFATNTEIVDMESQQYPKDANNAEFFKFADGSSNEKFVVAKTRTVSQSFKPRITKKRTKKPDIQVSPNTETEREDCQMICPLAEKEKEKWLNPIPLADNPYSLENINKRGHRKKNEYFRIGTYTGESVDFPEDLSPDEFSKKETEKLRFSRDYYVNASKHPSGMSSPSFNQYSKEYDQKSGNGKTDATHPEKNNKFTVHKMQDKQSNEIAQCRIIDKSQFSLPSVKELAKQFAVEDSKKLKYQNDDLQTKLESKHKIEVLSTYDVPEKEPEIDYSPVPISEIILNLQQSAEPPARKNYHKPIIHSHASPTTYMEICRNIDSNLIIKNHTETNKMSEQIEAVRFDGKEVHSLTARSISKKFREGLKNNSYQKVCLKINRMSSSSESDQGSIISNKTKTSPTPSVDLKNMKKFWEEIITANSNTSKQK